MPYLPWDTDRMRDQAADLIEQLDDQHDLYQSGVEDEVDPSLLLALLNVTPEAEIQREIRDMVDELDIGLRIVHTQETIDRFAKFAKESLAQPITGSWGKAVFTNRREDGEDTSRIMQQQFNALRVRLTSWFPILQIGSRSSVAWTLVLKVPRKMQV